MGWSSGAGLAAEIWDLFRPLIPEVERKRYARKIYDLFCELDADTWEPDGELEEDAGLAKDGDWVDEE